MGTCYFESTMSDACYISLDFFFSENIYLNSLISYTSRASFKVSLLTDILKLFGLTQFGGHPSKHHHTSLPTALFL